MAVQLHEFFKKKTIEWYIYSTRLSEHREIIHGWCWRNVFIAEIRGGRNRWEDLTLTGDC